MSTPIVIGRSPARAWHALEDYFFPTTTATRLAVMRIILALTQLVFFIDPLHAQLKLLAGPGFISPVLLIRKLLPVMPEAAIRTPEFLGTLWYVTVGAGVLSLVGLFSRTATFLFGVGNLLLISHLYSYGEKHHPEAIFMLTIVFVGMGPCGQCLSLDAWLRRRSGGPAASSWGCGAMTRYGMWPLLLAQWLLVTAYFEAFLAKATSGGLAWMNGYTLQNYMLQDAVKSDMPLGLFLAQFHVLCMFMAAGALALEGGFFIVMFSRWAWVRRIMPWVFIGGVMLHTMIYLTQAAPFFEFLVLYLMWVPWERMVASAFSIRSGAAPALAPVQMQPTGMAAAFTSQ